ncbi:hypothetical protein ACFL2Q_06040 [Thermodesulfobacteriota bacterium]
MNKPELLKLLKALQSATKRAVKAFKKDNPREQLVSVLELSMQFIELTGEQKLQAVLERYTEQEHIEAVLSLPESKRESLYHMLGVDTSSTPN